MNDGFCLAATSDYRRQVEDSDFTSCRLFVDSIHPSSWQFVLARCQALCTCSYLATSTVHPILVYENVEPLEGGCSGGYVYFHNKVIQNDKIVCSLSHFFLCGGNYFSRITSQKKYATSVSHGFSKTDLILLLRAIPNLSILSPSSRKSHKIKEVSMIASPPRQWTFVSANGHFTRLACHLLNFWRFIQIRAGKFLWLLWVRTRPRPRGHAVVLLGADATRDTHRPNLPWHFLVDWALPTHSHEDKHGCRN